MSSRWTHICSASELAARFELTFKLDPAFARRERAFYERRTAEELKTTASQAWDSNDADGYQMARSYLALKAAA